MIRRCPWVNENPLMVKYHDEEWGVAVRDDKKLFEFLLLDSFQAGLSWNTILNKRKNFRKAFDNFDYNKIVNYVEEDFDRLINDKGIIRNRLKIKSAIINAQKFLEVKREFGSFSNYLWRFVGNKQIKNRIKDIRDYPSKTEISDKISGDMKEKGFKFVGSTIIYAFMQAAGLVNDHSVDCFRYDEV